MTDFDATSVVAGTSHVSEVARGGLSAALHRQMRALRSPGNRPIIRPLLESADSAMAICPECEFDEIDTTDHEEGDELSCPECGKALVMAGPDRLDVADDDEDDAEEEEQVEDEDEVNEEDDD